MSHDTQERNNHPSLKEEQIREHSIGDLRAVSGTITIVEYEPRWPELFRIEAERVRTLLGSAARRIEHTGSTSVPGLAAKPIIDMLLVVADSADEQSYMPPLERAGYVLRIREPGWHEHRMLKGPGADINLHVFTDGCPEIDRILLFRDWLRKTPADRELYLRTKLDLAGKQWEHVDNYAQAKGTVIGRILARAGLVDGN